MLNHMWVMGSSFGSCTMRFTYVAAVVPPAPLTAHSAYINTHLNGNWKIRIKFPALSDPCAPSTFLNFWMAYPSVKDQCFLISFSLSICVKLSSCISCIGWKFIYKGSSYSDSSHPPFKFTCDPYFLLQAHALKFVPPMVWVWIPSLQNL
jgi:hypothetical protein